MAVREAYEQNAGHAGIACAMKKQGGGRGSSRQGAGQVGGPRRRGGDALRCLRHRPGLRHRVPQMLAETTGLRLEQMRNMGSNSRWPLIPAPLPAPVRP